jgi:hypothetical protein
MTVDPSRVQVLRNYYSQYLAQGYTQEMVTNYLLQNNFATQDEIKAAITYSNPTSDHKTLIFLTIALILIVILALTLLFFLRNTQSTQTLETTSGFEDISQIGTNTNELESVQTTEIPKVETIQEIEQPTDTSTYQEQGYQPPEEDDIYYNQIMGQN